MKFLYGVENNYRDITIIVYEKLIKNNQLIIPKGDDLRASIFGDHIFRVLKHVRIINDRDENDYFILFHDRELNVNIVDMNMDYLFRNDNREKIRQWYSNFNGTNVEESLRELHKLLTIRYGNINDEYDEQKLAMKYIKPDSVVLELGSNIGRNSCLIASILNDDRNLVTLESSPRHVDELTDNKQINGFRFHIVPYALSKRNLVQRYWETMESDVIPEGWFKVNTITWDQIKSKYNLKFDTLVADCEGALCSILCDEPSLLDNIKTIIVENDYRVQEQKDCVEQKFISQGFKLVENHPGGLDFHPCKDCFYQVWQK